MIRYNAALVLLLCGCSIANKDMRINIPNLEANSLQIEGMEFSDLGDKLLFWTDEHIYIYKVNHEANTPPTVFLLERTSLKEKTARMHIKALDVILARIKNGQKHETMGSSESLYAPYNVTLECESAENVLDIEFKKYVVRSGKRIIYSLSEKDITKEKEGASSLNEYSYLSPKGKYGYFIFSSEKHYGIHTITHLPELTVPIRKSYHVVVDITNRKIISNRCENKKNEVVLNISTYNKKMLRVKSRTMVAINEKLNMIAKFDLKTGMLTIEPIILN